MFDVHQMEHLKEFQQRQSVILQERRWKLLSAVRSVLCGVRKDDVADLLRERFSSLRKKEFFAWIYFLKDGTDG